MNPSTTDPQPPQPPQPHRPSTSCDRHPEENFTGFCPSCLCERLAVLHPSTTNNTASSSSSRKPPTSSTAAAALKAIFKPPIGGGGGGTSNKARPTSFFPELRRTKSFSASKNEGFSGVFEPQRKSCDVRGRSTLWCLFNQDDGNRNKPETEVVDNRNLAGSSSSFRTAPVFESKEEEFEEEEEEENQNQNQNQNQSRIEGEIEFGVFPETNVANVIETIRVPEILEEEEEEEINLQLRHQQPPPEPFQFQEEEMKPMKDHIDLDAQTKKRDLKEIAGSFWSAASVFSKKLQKWRQKQKQKKRRSGGGGSATLPVEKPIGRQFRETQSEIADYGFGRRSCDTDPRFSLDAGRMSLDAGRMSFDDPRYSFDEPRASWDGYLIGRTVPRMPTMLSVVEDAPVVNVARCDAQIPVEEPPMNCINEEDPDPDPVPGGSVQTRDYYTDSSSRRRKSLDRSNSIRKTAAAVVAEIDEMKAVSNSKVSPTTADYFHGGPKLVVPDRELRRDSNSNSLRDDCSETFEMAFRAGDAAAFRGGDSGSVVGNGERKECKQKSRRWSKGWNIWSFIHRRSGNKEDDEDRYSSRPNGVERSFSESWPELRGGVDRNGEAKVGFNPKIMRSNSCASWRNSHSFGGGGGFGSMRKNGVAAEPSLNGNGNGSVNVSGNGRKQKKEEFVLERNRSARHSPNHIDNGLLRFYLTPLRSSWRNGAGKSRSNHAHSIARSVLRLY